jgi:tellurium resistance protein TerD
MINLRKGQGFDLGTGAPGLTQARVGLGWDTGAAAANPARLDNDPLADAAAVGGEFDFNLELSDADAASRGTPAVDFDLDVSLFMLGASGKLPADEYFLFYNNLRSPDGAVVHQGDNRTGVGEGDDETILMDLSKVDAAVQRILILATIHDAQTRGQNFAGVRNAYIRLVNHANGAEVLRYALDETFSNETAVVFGELRRSGASWGFHALGQGSREDLQAFVNRYA